MERTYRLRRYYRNLGLGGILFWSFAFAAAVFSVMTDAPREWNAAMSCFMLSIPVLFVAISLYLLLAYEREKLVINDAEIEFAGIVRVKRMALTEVTSAAWRMHPAGGSLVLRAQETKITLYFENYQSRYRKEIVDFFSNALPQSVQNNWNLFNYKIASHYGREDSEPGEGEVRFTRRKMDVYIAVGVLAACCVGVYCWWLTAEVRFLFAPLVMGAILLVVRLNISGKGLVYKKLSHRPDDVRFLWFLLIWGAVGIGGLILCGLLEPRLAHPTLTMFVGLAVWVAITLVWAFRNDRRQRRRDIEAAEETARQTQLPSHGE